MTDALFWVIYIVVIVALMYFIAVRPQKKQQKKQAELLSSVAIGDSILTSSGFYGVVIDITDDTVIVEFGSNKNCRIPMQKAAIVDVEKADTSSVDLKK
jgi:preprotein translocase subunit YajC